MAKDTLIDKHVSMKQCEKAIEALLKYTQKRRAEEDESSLFRDEEKALWLVIALKQMQPNDYKLKPHRMYTLATLFILGGHRLWLTFTYFILLVPSPIRPSIHEQRPYASSQRTLKESTRISSRRRISSSFPEWSVLPS